MSGPSAPSDPAALAKTWPGLVRTTLENIAAELGVPLPDLGGDSAEQTAATLVVVGEPKNGKSTLVNALLGRAGLSPVDFAVATATYIAIRHGEPGARVWPEDATGAEEIHLDELAAWTTVEGLKGNRRAPKSPRPVEVTFSSPFLEHITLIDTPGVGGLDETHDRATLGALDGATALLFCADGSRPLSAPEVRFLERATERIAHVTFALTKVDENAAWRDVLADNQAAVAKHAPSFTDAPWFPVAAPLAEMALAPGVAEANAQRFLERSGVGTLSAHLVAEVAGRAHILAAAGELKALRTVAVHFEEVARSRVSQIGEPAGDAQAQLTAKKEELEGLARVEDRWRADLEVSLSSLQRTEWNRLDKTLAVIREEGTALAEGEGVSTDAVAERVNSALAAESAAIYDRIAQTIDGILRDVVGDEVESTAFAMALATAERSSEMVELRAARDLVAEGRLQPAQQVPLMMSGTGAVMLTNMALSPLGLGAWALLPGFGIAVAASAAAFMFARRQSKITERKQWVANRVAEAQRDLQTVIDQRIGSTKMLVAAAVRDWIRTSITELKAAIAELEEQAKRGAAAQKTAAQTASARVDAVNALVRTCDTFIERLAPMGGAPPAGA